MLSGVIGGGGVVVVVILVGVDVVGVVGVVGVILIAVVVVVILVVVVVVAGVGVVGVFTILFLSSVFFFLLFFDSRPSRSHYFRTYRWPRHSVSTTHGPETPRESTPL